VDFEWDSVKSAATYQARGFDFAHARRLFAAGWMAVEDARADYGETRMKALGKTGPDILVVVYTVRVHRCGSSRPGENRMERALWQSRA
jgi:uncharacterized protein